MFYDGEVIIPLLYGTLVDNKKEQLLSNGINEVNAIIEAATFGYWIFITMLYHYSLLCVFRT
jgi:hypothetical protein